jgi:adenylate kinase family enzyme
LNHCATEVIKIIVEKVRVEGKGVILLTGPSSCGKGEIAKALCGFLSIPPHKHLSMGDILRNTVQKARQDQSFRHRLAEEYQISDGISIFERDSNKPEITDKAMQYREDLIKTLHLKDSFASQLDWLEFCVACGLLVPDEWTVRILDALLEHSPEYHDGIIILDGYPRTRVAAGFLLETLSRLRIPVIKVVHLSITKEEMKKRALSRKRLDDDEDSLERRYQFYIDKVQPCIEYLKYSLGTSAVALIDANQPVYGEDGQADIHASIGQVLLSVMEVLGLPRYLLDLKAKEL